MLGSTIDNFIVAIILPQCFRSRSSCKEIKLVSLIYYRLNLPSGERTAFGRSIWALGECERRIFPYGLSVSIFMFACVYSNDSAKKEERKVPDLLGHLYEYFIRHPETLPQENRLTADKEGVERAVADYLAGMTDRFAVEQFKRLFIPSSWVGYR